MIFRNTCQNAPHYQNTPNRNAPTFYQNAPTIFSEYKLFYQNAPTFLLPKRHV